jgi:hypothetical protein
MQVKHKGKVLVTRNDYATYTMADVPPLPDYKVVMPKGQFNGRIHAHYNIRMDPDLGMGWAALHWVACGCGLCKDQLEKPWVPYGNITHIRRCTWTAHCGQAMRAQTTGRSVPSCQRWRQTRRWHESHSVAS